MHLFLQSLARHFQWWLYSLHPGHNRGAPLVGRRLLFLLLCYPLFLLLQLLHWLGFLCDEIFFAGYRKVRVEAPVFVLGIPRSGTTFLHRTLAEDRARFTSFHTWEAILAPSVTERKLAGLLRSLDRALGAPAHKLIQKLMHSASGDFDKIHEVGLSAPEEDYLSLLPAGGCFIMLLAFPFSPQLQQLGRLDQMPERERTRWIHFYQRALQRHLYCHPDKRLLSKNAAFASWAGALHRAFPDAKFLICVREPSSALSSQLSSLAPARRFFGTDPDGSHTARLFTRLYEGFYNSLADFVRESPAEQAAVLAQSDLKAAPAPLIAGALQQLGIEKSPAIDQALAAIPPGQTSAHRHDPDDFSLDTEAIKRCMDSPYQTMLQSPNRSLSNAPQTTPPAPQP